MKAREVVIGQIYYAKVSGKIVSVMIERENFYQGWWARDLETNRTIHIRTAGRLRGKVAV